MQQTIAGRQLVKQGEKERYVSRNRPAMLEAESMALRMTLNLEGGGVYWS
jgi:hypothetical protein